MKKNRIISISFSLLLLLFVFSCKKEVTKSNNSSNYNKIFPNNVTSPTIPNGNATVFSTGNNDNTFAQGGGNTFSGGGHSSGIVDDPSCLIGTWIVPPDPTLPCPAYGFHLRLVFNTDGTGHATHIDEFLCTPNIQFDFTWALNGGILHLEFDNGSISNTPFSCPASSLTIMWLTSNPKTLQKV